jgi:hypothetical protein
MSQTTLSRIFPKETSEGVIENVALDAFDHIRAIVEDEFENATFDIADEDGPGFYPMGFVPFAHLVASITADEEEIDSIIERIDPLVEEVVTRFTRQLVVSEF